MKIFVKAKAGAREEKVEKVVKLQSLFGQDKEPETEVYKVSVKEPPVDGRANRAIAKLLAQHFNISISAVTLISGATSKNKRFEIKS